MRAFTDKQQRVIELKANGMKSKEAGILAGYSPNTADVQVSKLMQRPEVRKAIADLRKKAGVPADGQVDDADKPRMKDKYESSLDLMRDTYNNPKMPYSIRLEAAKQALPYEHSKLGEQGKKQRKEEDAKQVARGRFSPKGAPTNVVSLRK